MVQSHSAFLGDIPKNYDTGLGPILFDHFGKLTAGKVAAAAPGSVLEIAAGSGIVTRHILDALPKGASLTATDLNEPMLGVARGKFGPHEAVAFQPADAQDLPFEDDSFDVVVTQFGHMFFPDRPRAYSEAVRVLKPGGSYLFTTWGNMHENPFARIVHGTLADSFAGDPPGFYRVPFSLSEPQTILAELAAAGFGGARHEAMPHRQAVPDFTLFANGLIFGNPSIDEVRARSGDADAVRDELVARLRAEFGDDPTDMPLLAHCFEVTLP